MNASVGRYLATYAALILLLALTTGAYFLHWGVLSTVASLFIAAVKTFLIISVFMRAREGPPLIRLAASIGFFWLIILFGLMATDYATRIWVWHAPIG